MTKTKSTKRALLMSGLALLMCVSMLIGSTFAWFTDSVTSAGNTIQSGTLKVDLVDEDGNSLEGKVLKFVDQDENDLWEPGCKYNLQKVFVANKGNLALKYEIVINGITGDAKLLEAIEWTVTVGTETKALSELNGFLLPNTQSDALVLSGHMKESAGNEYQGLTVEGISISVFATQYTYEKDSFDDQYDKDAFLTVTNAAEAQAALDTAVNGTIIYLAQPGNYGDLLIRVNEDSELVDYYYVMSNYGTNYYGQAGWQYAKRAINDLTIIGVDGAVINSLSTPDARDDAGNAKGTRNNLFEINDLKISNITVANGITFNVSNVQVGVSETETELVPHIKLNGLTIDNCKTTTGGDMASKPGRKLLGIANTGSTSNAKNIVVTNCTVTDMYQGVYIVDGENVRVEGNTFTNLTHNAIHINSFCSGNIVIANNKIANVAERPIRFNKVASGTVTIKDNTITNSGDTAGELFKASSMGVDVTWKNNTIDGFHIKLSTVGTDIIGTKPVPVTSTEELKAALSQATAGDFVYLSAGEFSLPTLKDKEEITIIGTEGTVVGGESVSNGFGSNFGKNTTIKNVTFLGTSTGARWTYAQGGTIVFENCAFLGNDRGGFHMDESKGATLIFNNCTLSGFNAFAGDLVKVVLNGCTLPNNGKYNGLNMYCDLELNDCKFEFTGKGSEFVDFEAAGKTLTITKCTATMNGVAMNLADMIGGTYVSQTTITIDGVSVVK